MKYLLTFLFLLTSPAWGATYFIKNGGDNEKDGSSEGNAWETLCHACTTMTGGDSLLFMAGVYAESCAEDYSSAKGTGLKVTTALNGTSSDPTVFKNAPGYGRPTITAYGATGFDSSIVDWNAVSFDNNVEWVVLDSLIVKFAERGILLSGGSNITIQNCVACSTGALSGASNNGGICKIVSGEVVLESLTVKGCSLFANREELLSSAGNFGQLQLYGTRRSWIHDNVMFDGYDNEGLIYIKGMNNHKIEIYNNVLYDANLNAGGGIMILEGPDSCIIHHNIIYEVKKGIVIWEYESGGPSNVGHLIYNNTIFNLWSDGGAATTPGINLHSSDNDAVGGKGIEVFNNIVVNSQHYENLQKESDFEIEDDDKYIDYNCYYNSGSNDIIDWDGTDYTIAEARASLYFDSSSVGSYPVFADTANKDFSLTESSPDSVKTGGRGAPYDTYMGAVEWEGEEEEPAPSYIRIRKP